MNSMIDIEKKNSAAIVVASGFSRRMGEMNKLLLTYEEKTLLEYSLAPILQANVFEQIIVVGRDPTVLKIAKQYDCVAIENLDAHLGMSQSVVLGVQAAKSAAYYMFFTADQPDFRTQDIVAMTALAQKDKIIVPVFQGKMASPTIFPESFKDKLLQLQGDEGGRSIRKKYAHCILTYEIAEEIFLKDVDTQQDFDNFCKMRAEQNNFFVKD